MSLITKCSKGWIVAASMGAVEALKDQGFCRWNYAIRSVHHSAKNNIRRSISQARNKLKSDEKCDSGITAAPLSSSGMRLGGSEESLRKVMYLSCWGPN